MNKLRIRNRLLAITSALIFLFLVDYGFRVYELTRLQNYGLQYVEVWTKWNSSYEADYLQNVPDNSGKLFDSNKYDRFVQRSGEASVDMYVLKTKVERSFVLPWHNNIQYAYADSTNYLDEYHQYLDFINWEYSGNQWPTMNFKTDSRISELSAVAVKSGEDAMPRLRLLEHLYTSNQ